MQGDVLTSDHISALDSCYNTPLPVADIGQDLDWWQLFYDLRGAGLVTFDDDSDVITITEAGRQHLAADSEEDAAEEDEDPAAGYTGDYISFLDTFYDAPVPADEVSEWWQDVQEMIGNGHLTRPDDNGYIHITEAGKALL